jgi:ubiquinone biosynthesis protein Coq4
MKQNFFSIFTLFFKVLWFKWCNLRDWLIELVAVKALFPVAGVIQRKSPGHLKVQELCTMLPGSFGRELGEHMQRYKIDFIPGFEEHDMKHLLLGYPLSVRGEMLLSAFEFGTGNRSFMTLGVFLPALIVAPELWPDLVKQFKRGRANKQVRKIHLKSQLNCQLSEVQNKLNIVEFI